MSKLILKLDINLNSDDNILYFRTIKYEKDNESFGNFIRRGSTNESGINCIWFRENSKPAKVNNKRFINCLIGYFKENKTSYLQIINPNHRNIIINIYDYKKDLEQGKVRLDDLVYESSNSIKNLEHFLNNCILLRCDLCGYSKETLIKEARLDGTKYNLCSRCVIKEPCSDCKEQELTRFLNPVTEIDEEGVLIQNSFKICSKCSKNYTHCKNNCGRYYRSEIYETCPCYIPHDFKKLINPYNADVTQILSPDIFCLELFGVEVEVGTLYKHRINYNTIHQHTKSLVGNDAIMVYDSSIDYLDGSEKQKPNKYRGMEIVTRPMTYKNTLRFLRTISKNHHPLLRSWEVGTAGVHIHTSKAALTRTQIGKLLLFINDEKNRQFLRIIAKREDKKYAKFLKRKITDYADNNENCHYYALNTRKPHTIELRIFRGTLNPTTLVSYLQFFKSLIEFIKVAPNGVVSSSEKNNLYYTDYIDWLNSTEKSRFRELKIRINNELRDNKIVEEGEI